MNQLTATAVPRPLLSTRKIVHMSMLGFAFLLPFLTWLEAAGAAVLALVFNLFLLPNLGADLRKIPPALDASSRSPHNSATNATEEPGAYTGIILYPISVLVLILLYRHHLEIAAAAWAIMALGDGAAGIAGEGVRSVALPWNHRKTWAGFVAFTLAGTAGAYVLTRWVNPSLPTDKTFLICALTALLGTGIESTPIGLDDNVSVPLVCGGFMFCAWLVERSALDSNLPYLGRRLALAVVINLAFALGAMAARTVSRSGAALGFVLGVLVYLGWGWKSFLVLLAMVVLGSLATRLGYARKAERGVAEHAGGARSWREALANIAPGAFFAVLVIATHQEHAFLVAFVAAFAEAAGDTVASEIGQWLSPRAHLVTTWQAVAAGENGGISLIGTSAGLLASAMIVTLGFTLGLASAGGAAVAFAAAVAGNLLDSVLGATLERRGLVTNGVVNFTGTSFAGALALAFTLR
ncbi:MAG TPA: DUF92 domain-containing protein [Terriglobia bacterium]|nr:DUF92 domain-containing protein [Terriglobia bacterium]